MTRFLTFIFLFYFLTKVACLKCFVGSSDLFVTEECPYTNAVCLITAKYSDFERYCEKNRNPSLEPEINRNCSQSALLNKWDCTENCKKLGDLWTCCCHFDSCNKKEPLCPGDKPRDTNVTRSYDSTSPKVEITSNVSSVTEEKRQKKIILAPMKRVMMKSRKKAKINKKTKSPNLATSTESGKERNWTNSTKETNGNDVSGVQSAKGPNSNTTKRVPSSTVSSTSTLSLAETTHHTFSTTKTAKSFRKTTFSSTPRASTPKFTVESTTTSPSKRTMSSKPISAQDKSVSARMTTPESNQVSTHSANITKTPFNSLPNFTVINVESRHPRPIPMWPNYVAIGILVLIGFLTIILGIIVLSLIIAKRPNSEVVVVERTEKTNEIVKSTVFVVNEENDDEEWPAIPTELAY